MAQRVVFVITFAVPAPLLNHHPGKTSNTSNVHNIPFINCSLPMQCENSSSAQSHHNLVAMRNTSMCCIYCNKVFITFQLSHPHAKRSERIYFPGTYR
jgi:hypothetical protein